MNWVLVHVVQKGEVVRRLVNAATITDVIELVKDESLYAKASVWLEGAGMLFCTETFEQVVSQLPGYGVVTVKVENKG